MNEFGERLRAERVRLGFNQGDFGALAGVTRDAQLNYEKGTRSPSADYLMALMAHGVDVYFLLAGSSLVQASEGLSAEQTSVLRAFDKIDASRRDSALLVLDALGQYSG